MSNMTVKEKFLFVFLQVITFGLIWIYWNSKKKSISKEDELSFDEKTNLDIKKLVNCLGNQSNIKAVSYTHTKVKIEYSDRSLLDVNAIKEIKGVSGVFVNDSFITIIVGNVAKVISDNINSLINVS